MSSSQPRSAGSAPYYTASTAASSGARFGRPSDGRPYRLTTPSASGTRPSQGPPSPPIPQPPLIPQAFIETLQQLPPPQEWPSRLLSYFVVDPVLSLFRFVLEIVISPRTHRIILRLSVLSTLFWLALGLAIAGYVGFYRAWVPDTFVSRHVWLQYGEGRPPFAEIDLHAFDGRHQQHGVFAQDQEYDISLDLIVPLSAANLDLGNFMVTLDLVSAQNVTVHRVSKPCIIVHEPAPIRAMNNLMYQFTQRAPALILPTSSPPVQLLTISLLHRAILEPAHSAHPFASTVPAGVVRGRISVGRHDADKYWIYGGGHGVGGVLQDGSGVMKAASAYEGFRSRGELQTHSASIRFDAHLTGLRYFMYHHPLASFVFFTSLFMAFELVSALTLWAIAAFYTSSYTQPSLAVEDNYVGRGSSRLTDTDATPLPSGLDGEDEEDYSTEVPTPESDERRRQSLASLQARDAHELYEQRRAEMLRDELEGRRMTAVDQTPSGVLDDLGLTQGRRVLGRLDEETEEETDVHASETSAGWEDVVGEEEDSSPAERQARTEQGAGAANDDSSNDGSRLPAGLRRRAQQQTQVKGEGGDDDDESLQQRLRRESTIGGSSTSRASSVRSFGATSLGTSAPSRAQTESTPEVKLEDDEDEEEGDDTEREGAQE